MEEKKTTRKEKPLHASLQALSEMTQTKSMNFLFMKELEELKNSHLTVLKSRIYDRAPNKRTHCSPRFRS
jgi:hypothetical protein